MKGERGGRGGEEKREEKEMLFRQGTEVIPA